jgi:hypothetical protein
MAVIVPIVTTFNAKGINKAISDFKKLETTGQKVAFGMRGVDQAAMATTKALAKMGAVTAVAVGVLGRPLINAASSLEESMSKVNVVFGAGATKVKDFASTAATSLGLSKQQALEAAGTYGNLFQAFGTGQTQAAEMSTQLVQLAADLASFNNTSVDDALMALRSGLSGEAEPLKRFGIAINDARLKTEAMNLGLYKGKGVLDVTAKSQAAFALIMKDSSLAQGDFARTSDGVANQQRILAAQFKDIQAELGTALLPVFKTVLNFLNERFVPALREIANVFGKDGIAAGLKATGTAFLNFTTNLGATGTAVLTLVTGIIALRLAVMAYNTVMALSAVFLPIFVTSLRGATVAQTQLNVAMYANPIGLVVAAVVALIAGMVLLYMRFEIVRKVINTVAEVLKVSLMNALIIVNNFFLFFINAAIDGINLLIGAANFFGADIEKIGKKSYVALKRIGDGADYAKGKLRGVAEVAGGMRAKEGGVGKVLEELAGGGDGAGGGAAKTIETVKEKLEKYTSALNKVKDAGKGLTQANKSVVESQKRVTAATQQVTDAQIKLAESVTAVEKAEAKLEKVRQGLGAGSDESKKAARAVEDAQRDLEDSGYAVEDAQYQLIDAEKELIQIRENSESSLRDIREAEISFARAKLSLTEAILGQKDRTVDLSEVQKEYDEITNGATEGTDRYKEALDAVTEAKKANADATRNLQEARDNEIAANSNLVDSIDKVAAAQWSLFDAEKALSELRKTTGSKIIAKAEADVEARETAPPGFGSYDQFSYTGPGGTNAFGLTQAQVEANFAAIDFSNLFPGGFTAFANGGVVTSPMMGMVGEAGSEAIIPLDRLSDFGGQTINVTINAGIGTDASKVGDEIVNVLQRYNRRNGALPLKVA